MLSRIKYLQKTRNITNEQLAAESGLSVWTVQKQTSGAYKLNIEIILALLRLCPDVSADWILLGRESFHSDTQEILSRLERLESKIDEKITS